MPARTSPHRLLAAQRRRRQLAKAQERSELASMPPLLRPFALSTRSVLRYLSEHKILAALGGIAAVLVTVFSNIIWPTYQYYYQNVILPASEPPNLIVSNEIADPMTFGSMSVAHATVKIQNISKVRVQAVASWYNVSGIGVATVPPEEPYDVRLTDLIASQPAGLNRQGNSIRSVNLNRHFEEKDRSVVASGELLPDAYILEPGEEINLHFLILLPADRYEMVRHVVNVLFLKKQGQLGYGRVVRPMWEVDHGWLRAQASIGDEQSERPGKSLDALAEELPPEQYHALKTQLLEHLGLRLAEGVYELPLMSSD